MSRSGSEAVLLLLFIISQSSSCISHLIVHNQKLFIYHSSIIFNHFQSANIHQLSTIIHLIVYQCTIKIFSSSSIIHLIMHNKIFSFYIFHLILIFHIPYRILHHVSDREPSISSCRHQSSSYAQSNTFFHLSSFIIITPILSSLSYTSIVIYIAVHHKAILIISPLIIFFHEPIESHEAVAK